MTEQQYTVTGMTCENCRRHVTEALSELPGAREVHVDLASGRVVLRSEAPLGLDEVRNALSEAGYGLA